ncbi:hypothetical protein PAPYR_12469 [Paratrimastix pyriformis]|uniref:Uncharacterized protein n=1 Tax=Paratrimastix pyriformis TaxID=342808 RepID=A0ABQ8U442_9EUKA|nr:hypothetical protein PAPYR_12469 [Paratrimastix pyriformis]
MRSSSGNALTPSTSGVLRDRSLLERTDYYGEQFPRYSWPANVNTSLSADERKTYDWSIQCHKFRTSTCSRELPTLWDFLLTGPLPLPLPRLDVFSRKKEEEVLQAVARQVLEQKVGGSIPASDEVKKPEGFPGPMAGLSALAEKTDHPRWKKLGIRPPRRKIEIVMGTLQ